MIGRGIPAARLVQWRDRRALAGSHARPLQRTRRETHGVSAAPRESYSIRGSVDQCAT